MQAMKHGDLYLSSGRGGGGLGDPLLRSDEAIDADVAGGHIQAEWAERAYGRADRDGVRRQRLQRGRPTQEWWAQQRDRILAQELIEPVKVMFAESMRLEPGWAAEFRGAWDLPEDFDFDVITPTVAVARAEPGKLTPEESVGRFLAQATAYGSEEIEVPIASEMTKDLLADLLDEKLSRAAVKEIQSSLKDPDRFDIWVELLQERVAYDDPIVLPFGEGLNIVRRRGDGELMIRTDAGHDLCRWDQNWKMRALVFVRDTDELYQEIYPRLSHPEGEWMELREYYCPVSGHLLETEAVPPGYPVVHGYLPDIDGFYSGWLRREIPA
jgi:acetone carboxylase gamma subunit